MIAFQHNSEVIDSGWKYALRVGNDRLASFIDFSTQTLSLIAVCVVCVLRPTMNGMSLDGS